MPVEKLAIHGGTPVRPTLLPYGRQSVEESDLQAVTEVLRSDWLTTGPNVNEFEETFARYVSSSFAVAVSSGTAALHAATFAAGIGPGDETITTPLTFCATANCVIYQGGHPKFVDIVPDTLNVDPEHVSRAVTSKTKAIYPVAYAGQPADLDLLVEVARKRNLVIIEDACHALGAEYKGRKTGSIADMTVFSFHPVKHITTGEGGMVTTNDSRLAEKLRRFRNHGINSSARERHESGQFYYDMIELGFNYRISDFACALGHSQLNRLEENLRRRRQIAKQYDAAFAKVPGVRVPAVREDVRHAYHLYVIEMEEGWDRDEVFRALRAENIGVNVHYLPVYLHTYYRQRYGYKRGECPLAEDAYNRLITLPMFHSMTAQDVEDVIRAVEKVAHALHNKVAAELL